MGRRGIWVWLLLAAYPSLAVAQTTEADSVKSADDAFGSLVGLETSGIYSENDARGFSPLKAGNARIEGVYFDQVGTLSLRLRAQSTMRVGMAALGNPFPAPTGIVDHQLRPAADDFGVSSSYTFTPYGGRIRELDLRVPVVGDHLSIAAGVVRGDNHWVDGAVLHSDGIAIRPIVRWRGGEFTAFWSLVPARDSMARPLTVLNSARVPNVPRRTYYFGQDWARFSNNQWNSGAILRTRISPAFAFQGGYFSSLVRRRENFTQLFLVNDTSGAATQVVIADPRQRVASRSWEGLLSIQPGGGVGHRFIIGLRGRGRQTETGGSDIRNFGPVTLGERDIEAKPAFVFGKLNVGSLLQTSLMAAYLGTFEGVGQVNLGVQRVRYRATFVTGAGQRSATESDPWLFNASVSIDLSRSVSLFVGTVRGLEDSGTAPETAANRNEQLPATRTRQYDGGLRWRMGCSELVLTAFEIVKPYFAFDTGNRWIETGAERHRGIEGSFVSHLAGDRLTILAGAVAMKPVVVGNPRELGAVGRRPAGTPSLYARADINYRTDLLGSLTPTAAIVYTGRRAVGSQTFAELGERQPMLGAVTTVDIGLRERFVIGSVPASVRLLVLNVFDRKGWKVVAGNTLQANDRRRLQLALAADF